MVPGVGRASKYGSGRPPVNHSLYNVSVFEDNQATSHTADTPSYSHPGLIFLCFNSMLMSLQYQKQMKFQREISISSRRKRSS